jgi:allantoin racemase
VKLLIINPNTTAAMTDEIRILAERAAAPGTEITCLSPEAGPPSVEGHADEVLAAYNVLDVVASTAGEYDGYVIACFGDPALDACREIADVPVIGIAEAAFHLAAFVGHKWSIVGLTSRAEPFFEDLVTKYGFQQHCASIRCVPLGVLEIVQDMDRTKALMLDAAQRAIEEDGAEAILLGCAGMGPIDKAMQEELGVPVIDGTAAAVKMLEGLIAYGVTTSRIAAFMPPERKELVDCPPSLDALYQREQEPASA